MSLLGVAWSTLIKILSLECFAGCSLVNRVRFARTLGEVNMKPG